MTKHVFEEGFEPFIKRDGKEIPLRPLFTDHPSTDLSYCPVQNLQIPKVHPLKYKAPPTSGPGIFVTIDPTTGQHGISFSMFTTDKGRLIYDCDTFNYQCGSPMVSAAEITTVYSIHAGTNGDKKGNYGVILCPPPVTMTPPPSIGNIPVPIVPVVVPAPTPAPESAEARDKGSKGQHLNNATVKRDALEQKEIKYEREIRQKVIERAEHAKDRAQELYDDGYRRGFDDYVNAENRVTVTKQFAEDAGSTEDLGAPTREHRLWSDELKDAKDDLDRLEQHMEELHDAEDDFKEEYHNAAVYSAWIITNKDKLTPEQMQDHRAKLKDLWTNLYSYFDAKIRESQLEGNNTKQSGWSRFLNLCKNSLLHGNAAAYKQLQLEKHGKSESSRAQMFEELKSVKNTRLRAIKELLTKTPKHECCHIQQGDHKCPEGLPVSASKLCGATCTGRYCTHWYGCVDAKSIGPANESRRLINTRRGYIMAESVNPKNVVRGGSTSSTAPTSFQSSSQRTPNYAPMGSPPSKGKSSTTSSNIPMST